MYEYLNMGTDGYGSQATYMQECTYPFSYHQTYGHMYSQPIGPESEMGMMYPMMYPDIYYKVYPYVSQVCDKMDNPYIIYPSDQLLEKMIDDCYDMCVTEMPELEEYAGMVMTEGEEDSEVQQRRRRPLLRDLIAIILLSELFRRRRRRPWTWENSYNDHYMW